MLTSLVIHIAHDDVDLHTKLRRDIVALTPAKYSSTEAIRLDVLQVVALIEALSPVKIAMF